ncbi:MAG: potassium transporter TrkG, partial [Spirochaetales bacterium]
RVVRRFSIDNIENNPRNIVKNILFYAFIIQGVGFLCLMPTLKMHGVEDFVFDALFLSVSAFCNAGFAVYSDSLAQFNNSVFLNAVIMALIILGGIGFIVLQNIRQRLFGTKKHVSLHTKIVLYITAGLILLGAAVFFMIDFSHAFADLPLHGKISAAFFQSVTPRTCGFETIPQSSFSFTSNLFTVFLMFIGGSPASVAGGIKTTTFFIALLYAIAGDEQKSTVNILKRRLSAETINKSVNIIIRSVLILFFAVLLLSITEAEQLKNGNIGAFDLLFETVSAFGTVGLSLGLTSSLSFGGKIIIILTMFIGRTALAGMMISLPGFEIQRKAIKYPHEDILIG